MSDADAPDAVTLDLRVWDVQVLRFEAGPDTLYAGPDDDTGVGGVSAFVALGPFCLAVCVIPRWCGLSVTTHGPPRGHCGVRIFFGSGLVSIWHRLDCWINGECTLRGEDDGA